MRRRLFDWHLTLGSFTGALLLIWSLSGIAMIAEPLIHRLVGTERPRLAAPSVDPRAFSLPASGLALEGPVAAMALRQFAGRSWYQVLRPDGTREGYDAATGRAVSALLDASDVAGHVDRALQGTEWKRRGEPVALTEPDDFYRRGDFPAFRVDLEGPGALVVYVSALDGSAQKWTDRPERFFRWIGMGVHTWNVQAFRKHAETARRTLLCLGVGLPLAVMAALSLWLLVLRNRTRGIKRGGAGPGEAVPVKVRAATGVAVLPPAAAPPGPGSSARSASTATPHRP